MIVGPPVVASGSDMDTRIPVGLGPKVLRRPRSIDPRSVVFKVVSGQRRIGIIGRIATKASDQNTTRGVVLNQVEAGDRRGGTAVDRNPGLVAVDRVPRDQRRGIRQIDPDLNT